MLRLTSVKNLRMLTLKHYLWRVALNWSYKGEGNDRKLMCALNRKTKSVRGRDYGRVGNWGGGRANGKEKTGGRRRERGW